MTAPSHRIGRLRFDFATASLGDALQLRARAEEIAWRRLPFLIAAVCDALAPAGLHVRIDRLALDLGACRPDALERDLPAAFEHALRAALGEAIAAALHAPGAQASACLPEAAALDEMAAYLLGGMLPMRHGAAPFDPGAALAQLIGGQPVALVALLRRLAHERHAIERLVRQTGQPALHALLAALTPANSAVILAYLADFQRFHAQAASLHLAPASLRRVLWIVTLGYLLHAADSQFNRRMFLARLIEAVAAAEGIAHGELLMLLHGVAGLARKRQPLAGPLLGVLDELLRPFGSGTGATIATVARIDTASAGAHDLGPLLALLRANAGEPQALAQLLQPMPASLFARLVRRLQPVQAALILDYMAGLSALHQARPRLPIGAMALRRQLRVLVLRYFLLDAGTQFNRLRWLRRLLHELAASTGVSYRLLLDTLTEAVALLRQRTPLAGSLPESLAALAADAAQAPAPAPAPSSAPGELAALLARLRAQAGHPAALAALVRACPPALFARLVEHLAPPHATTILADIAQLAGAHHLWALLGDASLGQRVAPAALQLLLDPAPAWHERGDWLRRLLQTLAAGTPLGYDGLLPALAEWRRRGAPDSGLRRALARLVHAGAPAAPPAPHDAEAAMALAERFLRTGRPHAGGAPLPALATAHPSAFAALLRRLHVAMSRNTGLLLERLLGWMLPEEVAAALLPGQVQAAACWADLLADQEHASMATAWRRVLATALRGEALQAPGALAPPAARLDRAQLLRHCLDTGALPWWAPAGTSIASLLAPCARLPLAFLHGLFFDASPAIMAGRLRRLSDLAGAEAATAVMARLAPWPAGADSPPPPAAAPDAAPLPGEAERLLAWLSGSRDTPPGGAASWRRLAVALAGEDKALDGALRAGLAQPAVRQRWAAVMPHDVLARIAHRLAPRQARCMLDLMTVVLAAWRRSGRAGNHTAHATLWHALLALLADTPMPAPRMIAARLLGSAAAASAAVDAGVANRLRAQAQWLARQGGYANVSAALQAATAASGAPATGAQETPARPAPRAAPQDGETVYLANAGLVLLHPFLPHFFRALNLLRDHPASIANSAGADDATRAVHLLQYLVDQRCDAAEPELVLNKLLCGLAPDTPVGRAITPTPEELAVCDSLLGAVIGNWPAIAATSRAGLRETFLQRDGRLQLRDGKWKLTVARKTVDVLVDMLPWAISMVLHPWMPAPLSVEW